MPSSVTIEEAEVNLVDLVRQVQRGEEVVIRRGAKPVAKIVRYVDPIRSRSLDSSEGRSELAMSSTIQSRVSRLTGVMDLLLTHSS